MANREYIESFSDTLQIVELAEEGQPTRALIRLPLMHVGANKKNLKWEPHVLQKTAPMFRGVTFKYDLQGKEGSSHVPKKLSSPFYDVGWTYDNEKGAYFDGKTLWVEGEVTHPEVLEKLRRKTSDGKREINFGSMGVYVDPKNAHCSICGARPFGTCQHVRGQSYGGQICQFVPDEVEKALHVALTNDPADTEADIRDVLFQEAQLMEEEQPKQQQPEQQEKAPEQAQEQEPVAQPGDQSEVVKALAEKVKEIDQKVDQIQNKPGGQIKMPEEEKKPVPPALDKKAEKPAEKKEETASAEEEMEKKKEETAQAGMVKCPACGKEVPVPSSETAEDAPEPKDKSAEQSAGENSAPKVSEGAEQNEGNRVNEAAMKKPSEYADNSKEKTELLAEVADMSVKLGKYNGEHKKAFVELADRSFEQLQTMKDVMEDIKPQTHQKAQFASNVPEFGAPNAKEETLEVADMNASQRAEKFGEFGKYEACFNPSKASRFVKE